MSKVLRVAGQIAGAIATVAAFIPGGQAVAGIAGIVSAAATLGAQVTAKPPSNERQGLQISFKVDPGAPIPYVIGRTAVGGTIVHRETYGTDNHYQTFLVALSLGPCAGIDARLVDRAAIPFNGTRAQGYYAQWMWQDTLLGATPESRALGHGIVSPPFGSIPAQVPGWSTAHRMSGYAAVSLSLLFDTKARRYQNGEPLPGWVLRGNLVWDPRLDSTYPGGSGTSRRDNPATWVYSETPALHALKWRLGVFHNGKRVMGVGAPIDLIDVAAIVESANVQEANGWTVGGELNSGMDRWEALKLIEEAGGSEPIPSGGRMSTLQKMPRVPIGVITGDDILEARSIPAMKPRRERLTGFRARFRSEAHGWEMVPIDIVEVPAYVTADGKTTTGSQDFSLVQNADQCGSLAAYKVFDSREIGPIELVLKPRFIGYRIGDCLTVDADETGLSGKQVIIRGRSIDPATGRVTMTFETETPGKHAAALGQTGEVPPVPTLTFDPDIPPAPDAGDWMAMGGVFQDGAYKEPAVFLTGAVGNTNAANVLFEIRVAGTTEWFAPSIDPQTTTTKVFRGLISNTAYEASVSYIVRGVTGDRRILGPVTTGALEGIAGPPGRDGVSAYAILLTNENHILPANADGSIIIYNGASTDVVVYAEGQDVTDDFALSIAANPQALTVTLGARTATVTGGLDIAEPNGTLTLRLTGSGDFAGIVLDKVFSLTKSRAGADGTSPPLITIEATTQLARYDASGNYVGGPITFNVIQQNVVGNSAFRIERVSDGALIGADTAAGWVAFSPANYSSTGPFNLTFAAAAVQSLINTHGSFRVVANSSGTTVADSVTIVPVSDGSNGSDGLPGAPGADGITYYPYYAYANSPDGAVDFTTASPGTRAYVGFATGTSPGEPTLPSSYVWSAYRGPPFGLASRGNAVIAGASIIKNGGVSAWDSDAYSTSGHRNGARVAFKATPGSNLMAGLNADPVTDANYTSLDYAWSVAPSGEVRIYESGNIVLEPFVGYGADFVFQVVYDGRFVRYYVDANGPYRTVDVGPDKLLYFDCSLAEPNSRINEIAFESVGARGVDGSNGVDGVDGLPGVDGADGVTYYPYYAYANSPDGAVDFTTASPGTRAYVGFATGTSPTEPTLPSAYAWTAYKGPPFGLASRGTAVIAGSSIIKNGGADAWDSDAYSTSGFRNGAKATFKAVPGSNLMAGLNSDPNADADYQSLDYAWAVTPSGQVRIYEDGDLVADPFSGFGPDFVFQVVYDGQFVRYYVDDNPPYREVEVGPGKLLYFDCSLAMPGSRINDATFDSVGAPGRDGVDGLDGTDGLPGAPGANGQTTYVHFAYADSADGLANFTTGAAGNRFYVGVYTDFIAADSLNPAAYTWSLQRGADGANGTPGAPGTDGQPSYVHIAYADNASGTANFSVTDPTGRRYIGVYTDNTLADSTNPALYSWSLIKGDDGVDGLDGTDGFIVDTETPAFLVPVYSSGASKPGWSGGVGTIRLTKGGAQLFAGVTYAVLGAVNIASLALAGNQFSFAGVTADAGYFFIRATHAGINYDRRIDVKKVYDGEAAFRGSVSASGQVTGANTLTATGATVVPAGRGCTVSAVFNYSMAAAADNSQFRGNLGLYWRNITDGGAWNFLGAQSGSIASVVNTGTPTEPEYNFTPGTVSAAFNFTAPSPDKQIGFEARLVRDSGAGAADVVGSCKLEVSS